MLLLKLRPYSHTFNIKPKANLTKKSKTEKPLMIVFYGVEIVKKTTGLAVCSYVEMKISEHVQQ